MHSNGDNIMTSDAISTWETFIQSIKDVYDSISIEAIYDPMRMKYYYEDHFDVEDALPTPDGEYWFPWQTNHTWGPAIRYGAPLTASMIGKPRDSFGSAIPLNGNAQVDTAEVLLAFWQWTDDLEMDMIETCHSLIADGMDGDFEFVYYSIVAIGNELLKSFLIDAPKFGMALILLFFFCAAFLWRRDLSRNKTMVILTGIGGCIMAIISGLGFGLGIGYPEHLSQLCMFMPFLILAIGMDDLFVLIRSYELTTPKQSAEARIAETMYEGGISITITSLTDFVAFLGGGFMIDMPAISDMCFCVAFGVCFLYFYTVTLVLSVMVCQARREDEVEKNCCACRLCGSTASSKENEDSPLSNDYNIDLTRQKTVERVEGVGTLPPHFVRFLKRNVTKNWWRIGVFLSCIAYLSIMSIGASKLFNKIGLDYSILAPKGSYLVDWYSARDRYLDEVAGPWAYLVVDDEECDYANEDIKSALTAIYESMADVECILGDLGDSWITRIENCMEVGCVESCTNTNWTTCYTWFQNVGTWWTSDNGWGEFVAYRGRFFDTSTMIPKATQYLLKMRASEIHSFDRIECLDGIWSRLEGAPCNMMAFNDLFPFFAGDKTTVAGTWQTMLFAMVSCLFLCLIFIPNLTVVLIIVFCIGFLLIGILGFTYWLGYRLDSVSQTLFIMGIGFAVDFAVHVCHSFLHARGNRVERVVEAVGVMGEAIFLAAISTILGVSLLFTSTSIILVGLAKLLSVIMIIGLFIAGILIPTILAAIGPNKTQIQIYQESQAKLGDLELTKDWQPKPAN